MSLVFLHQQDMEGEPGVQEDEVNVAEMLGVAEMDQAEAEEQVVLLQMPSLLPAPAPPPEEDAAAAKLRHQRREGAPPPPVALSLKDLPTGRVSMCPSVRWQSHGPAIHFWPCHPLCSRAA